MKKKTFAIMLKVETHKLHSIRTVSFCPHLYVSKISELTSYAKNVCYCLCMFKMYPNIAVVRILCILNHKEKTKPFLHTRKNKQKRKKIYIVYFSLHASQSQM